MVRTCLNGPCKAGERRGRSNKVGDVATALLKAVEICGHEMFALHRTARPWEFFLIWVIQVCAVPKGIVFQPFWSEIEYRFRSFWSQIK